MNYHILNDYIAKVPFNNPYNKPVLEEIKVIMSNNNVIQNPKLLIPLINTSMSITGQYPSIIKAKKSVASFKLRKGGAVGVLTTLRKQKSLNYLKLLNTYFLPRLITNQPSLINNKLAQITSTGNNSHSEAKELKNHSILSLGFNNISIFSYITPLEDSLQLSQNLNLINPSNLTGGYTQFSQKFTPNKKLLNLNNKEGKENLVKVLHKFFYSLQYIPLK
jgi:hypothetical protein